MYHLPQQSLEDFKQSLELALEMDIDHISSYGLILEPKTQFYNMYRKGHLKLPNEDLGADMYQYLMKRLEDSKLNQYEISNFGKKVTNQLITKSIGLMKNIMVLVQEQVVMWMV